MVLDDADNNSSNMM